MKRTKAHKQHRFYRSGQGDMPTQPFIALVPGMAAPLLPLDLPEGLRGQARERVARLQISDSIGLRPEAIELRPFCNKPHVSPWQRVILTESKQVARWRQEYGDYCQAILPDYLALPVVAGVWTIACTKDSTTARLGLEDGFRAEHALALAQLARSGTPKAVFRLGADNAALDLFLDQLDVPVCRNKAELDKLGLPAPEVLGHGELQFDLAKNPMAAFDQIKTALMAWRMPVILALLGLGMWSVSTGLALRETRAQVMDMRKAMIADVRENFVPVGPVLDVRTQISQALAKQQHAIGQDTERLSPLELFKAAAQVLAQQAARVTFVSYTPVSGLSLGVVLPDFKRVDEIANDLEQADIAVKISESSSAEDGGVRAVFLLQAKGGKTP